MPGNKLKRDEMKMKRTIVPWEDATPEVGGECSGVFRLVHASIFLLQGLPQSHFEGHSPLQGPQ